MQRIKTAFRWAWGRINDVSILQWLFPGGGAMVVAVASYLQHLPYALLIVLTLAAACFILGVLVLLDEFTARHAHKPSASITLMGVGLDHAQVGWRNGPPALERRSFSLSGSNFDGWDKIDPLELWQAAYLFAELRPPENEPKDDERITAWILKLRQCILNETLPASPSLSAMKQKHADFERRYGVMVLFNEERPNPGDSFSIKNISKNCKVKRSDLKKMSRNLRIKPSFLFEDLQ